MKKGLITITLKTAFREVLNLEALYLIGSFGVRLEGTHKWLTTLPEKITIGNLIDQEDIMLAWSPYEAVITEYVSETMEVTLEVVLTRKKYLWTTSSITA